jgi:hypothetical protein
VEHDGKTMGTWLEFGRNRRSKEKTKNPTNHHPPPKFKKKHKVHEVHVALTHWFIGIYILSYVNPHELLNCTTI